MSLIYSLTGSSERRAEDINQIGRALRGVLGITHTTIAEQEALGRLVLPRSSAAPGSPSEAQVYFDTDEGRAYFRNASAWVAWDVTRGAQQFELDKDVGAGRSYSRILNQRVTLEGGSGLYMWTVAIETTPYPSLFLEEGFDLYANIDDDYPFSIPSTNSAWVPRLNANDVYDMTMQCRGSYTGLTPGEHEFRLFASTTNLQRGTVQGYDDLKNISRTQLTIWEFGA